MPKIDTPTLKPQADKVWVEIPEQDNLEAPHPSIVINGTAYEAGNRYFVSAELAAEIEDRKKRYMRSIVRLTQTKQDAKSLQDIHGNKSSAGGQYTTELGES